MRDILILGANSQVGLEISLLCRQFSRASVKCVVRNDTAAVLLRAMGFACEVCDLNSAAFVKAAQNAGVVVECSWPRGRLSEQIRTIRERIERCAKVIPPGCVYVNLSSMNAFGWPEGTTKLRKEKLAKSPYAYAKRECEVFVARYCIAFQRDYVNLRLGQVHGALQSVSLAYEGIEYEAGPLQVLDAKAPIVWVASIAKYICQLAARTDSDPIRETILAVDSRPWRHRDLHDFYAALRGKTPQYSLRQTPGSETLATRSQQILTESGYLVWLAASLAHRCPSVEDRLYKRKRLGHPVELPFYDGSPLSRAIVELDGTIFNNITTKFCTSKDDAAEAYALIRRDFADLRERLYSEDPAEIAKKE
jgi:hypothetical protein